MREIAVIGAGNIGDMIAHLLSRSGDYKVTLADFSAETLSTVPPHEALQTQQLDVSDNAALRAFLTGKYAVLSAAPYNITGLVAKAAHGLGVHYLDLTEDVATTKLVYDLAENTECALIPQCGLAPGFISIVAADLAKRFDKIDTLGLRVGALPLYPTNSLGYNLNWSTDGVINEYIMPCEVVLDGKFVTVPPLEELEHFILDGVKYECFNTSGGLGSLGETMADRAHILNYKTIRYPGHRDAMKMLIKDLRLGEQRDLFKQVLESALPATPQDLVLIMVTAKGWRDGKLVEESYVNKVDNAVMDGRHWTAIQITTATAICTVLDMLANGDLPERGLTKQEDIPLQAFLDNRFGKAYATGQA